MIKSSDFYILLILTGNVYIFFEILIPRIYSFVTGLLARDSNLSLILAIIYGACLYFITMNVFNIKNAYEASEDNRKPLIIKTFNYLVLIMFMVFLIEIGNAYGVSVVFKPFSNFK